MSKDRLTFGSRATEPMVCSTTCVITGLPPKRTYSESAAKVDAGRRCIQTSKTPEKTSAAWGIRISRKPFTPEITDDGYEFFNGGFTSGHAVRLYSCHTHLIADSESLQRSPHSLILRANHVNSPEGLIPTEGLKISRFY